MSRGENGRGLPCSSRYGPSLSSPVGAAGGVADRRGRRAARVAPREFCCANHAATDACYSLGSGPGSILTSRTIAESLAGFTRQGRILLERYPSIFQVVIEAEDMLTNSNHRESYLVIQATSSIGGMLDLSVSLVCILSHPYPYQCVCRHTRDGLGVPRTLSGGSSVLLQINLIIIHLDHHTYNNLHYTFLPRTL